MNGIVLAGLSGFAAGSVMILISHLVLRTGGAEVRDLDRLRLFGKTLTRRESHVAGIVIHAILYGAAGIGFGALAHFGILSANEAGSYGAYLLILTLVFGGVILPLEGHGLFGSREDAWFAVDLLISNAIWTILFWTVYPLVL
jgi:hypothetical protein